MSRESGGDLRDGQIPDLVAVATQVNPPARVHRARTSAAMRKTDVAPQGSPGASSTHPAPGPDGADRCSGSGDIRPRHPGATLVLCR